MLAHAPPSVSGLLCQRSRSLSSSKAVPSRREAFWTGRLARGSLAPTPAVQLQAVSASTEAAANAVDAAATAGTQVVQKSGGGLLAPLTNTLEALLRVLQDGLDTLHVPYSYGYSIILLTVIVKVLTFPLTKQQVESAMAVQALKPRLDLIKARYGEDKEKVQKETSLLYEQAGVNPLAGCLPTLATIPIFIGLYSSLTNAANEGLFDTQGFFWIPSLAGPTSMAARQAGSGTAWLLPLVDGAPPIGWDEAIPYLSLPVLLVVFQYITTALTSPPLDPDDPNTNTTRALYVGLPLMVGWFSLNVPSGLGLYYLSNTVLTLAVQIYLKKLGGAKVQIKELGPVTKPGSGRRTGEAAGSFVAWESQTAAAIKAAREAELRADDEPADTATSSGGGAPATGAMASAEGSMDGAGLPQVDPGSVNRRVKRKKLALVLNSA